MGKQYLDQMQKIHTDRIFIFGLKMYFFVFKHECNLMGNDEHPAEITLRCQYKSLQHQADFNWFMCGIFENRMHEDVMFSRVWNTILLRSTSNTMSEEAYGNT